MSHAPASLDFSDATHWCTYVNVLKVGFLNQHGIGNSFHLNVPHAKVEVCTPGHERHDLDVLAREDHRVGLVLEKKRFWFVIIS